MVHSFKSALVHGYMCDTNCYIPLVSFDWICRFESNCHRWKIYTGRRNVGWATCLESTLFKTYKRKKMAYIMRIMQGRENKSFCQQNKTYFVWSASIMTWWSVKEVYGINLVSEIFCQLWIFFENLKCLALWIFYVYIWYTNSIVYISSKSLHSFYNTPDIIMTIVHKLSSDTIIFCTCS